MLQNALNDFAQRIGLPSLALNEAGLAALVIEGVGDASIERALSGSPADGDLLLTLCLPSSPGETPDLPTALERVNWSCTPEPTLSAALVHGRLILALRLSENAVTGAALENGLRLLIGEAQSLTHSR